MILEERLESQKGLFPEIDKLFKLLHEDKDGILKQSFIDFREPDLVPAGPIFSRNPRAESL